MKKIKTKKIILLESNENVNETKLAGKEDRIQRHLNLLKNVCARTLVKSLTTTAVMYDIHPETKEKTVLTKIFEVAGSITARALIDIKCINIENNAEYKSRGGQMVGWNLNNPKKMREMAIDLIKWSDGYSAIRNAIATAKAKEKKLLLKRQKAIILEQTVIDFNENDNRNVLVDRIESNEITADDVNETAATEAVTSVDYTARLNDLNRRNAQLDEELSMVSDEFIALAGIKVNIAKEKIEIADEKIEIANQLLKGTALAAINEIKADIPKGMKNINDEKQNS